MRARSRNPVPRGTSESRKPSRYSSSPMSLKWVVSALGQSFDDLHRVFDKGDTVAGVKTDPDFLAADLLEQGDQLVGSPVLVVLDGEMDLLSADGAGRQDQGIRRRPANFRKARGRVERLVPAARDMSRFARSTHPRSWRCGSRPRSDPGRPGRAAMPRCLRSASTQPRASPGVRRVTPRRGRRGQPGPIAHRAKGNDRGIATARPTASGRSARSAD